MLGSFVFRHENSCCPKSVAFFLLNAVLAVLSLSPSLCVRHAEHVVSLNSPVVPTVTWDWLSVLRGLVLGLLYSVEDFQGFIVSLTILSLIDSFFLVESEESLSVFI